MLLAQVAAVEVTVRQAHSELQRCYAVLGVDKLLLGHAAADVAEASVDTSHKACLSAIQYARDTGAILCIPSD